MDKDVQPTIRRNYDWLEMAEQPAGNPKRGRYWRRWGKRAWDDAHNRVGGTFPFWGITVGLPLLAFWLGRIGKTDPVNFDDLRTVGLALCVLLVAFGYYIVRAPGQLDAKAALDAADAALKATKREKDLEAKLAAAIADQGKEKIQLGPFMVLEGPQSKSIKEQFMASATAIGTGSMTPHTPGSQTGATGVAAPVYRSSTPITAPDSRTLDADVPEGHAISIEEGDVARCSCGWRGSPGEVGGHLYSLGLGPFSDAAESGED